TRLPGVPAADSSRSSNDAEHGSLASHFRLFDLGGGNRPGERGTQLFGRLQRKLHPRPRTGVELRVEEVERDDIAQRRMARVVIRDHRLRQREPCVPALRHAFRAYDLDDRRAHVATSYFARYLPKNA